MAKLCDSDCPVKTYLAVFGVTSLFMAIYEGIKEYFFDGSLTPWESHAITITVTAVLATIASAAVRYWVIQLDLAQRQAIEERERTFRTLADNLPYDVHRFDLDGRVLFANKALEATLGKPASDLVGKNAEEGIPGQGFNTLDEAIGKVATTGIETILEQTVVRDNAERRHHAIRIVPELGPDGKPISILAVGHDVTAQKQMEDDLKLAASVFHNSAEGVAITDADATILSVNPAFTTITGYSAIEVIGQKPSLLKSDRQDAAFYQAMWQVLLSEGHWQGEIWNRRKNGEAYLEWLTINRIADEGGVTHRYVSVFHDITEMRYKDERIHYLAFHDALTGLPNRTLFQERLNHALNRMRRGGGRLSVTFIDLDGFKHVNDSCGHDVGDLLLQAVAKRIQARLRRSVDTVARLGGDEFVVLMEDVEAQEHCVCLAREIIDDISQPIDLLGRIVNIGASMGIAFFPEHGADGLTLMRRADMAMYAAKAAGKGAFRLFDEDMVPMAGAR